MRKKEIFKAATVVVSFIGLFSLAFIGINNLMFARATGKTESISHVVANESTESALSVAGIDKSLADKPASTAEETEPASVENEPAPAVFTPPEVTVYQEASCESCYRMSEIINGQLEPTDCQNHKPWFVPSENALSLEEAVLIGAEHIWNLFGKSIDGKVVRMAYYAPPSQTRAYWGGYVGDSKEELDLYNDDVDTRFLFDFQICAVSGQIIDIAQTSERDYDVALREKRDAVHKALGKLSTEEYEELYKLRDAFEIPERHEEYMQIARNFAEKFYPGVEVTGLEIWGGRNYSVFEIDEDGNIIIAPSRSLAVTITYSTGREAYLGFDLETEELISIYSQHSDIIPGYSFDDGGLGVG
jgi:hypothetical protein